MKTGFKLLIVLPDGRIHRLKLGAWRRSFREAPLTATTLAGLVPPELAVDITLADESVDRVPFERKFDLVAISCITGAATRGYEIADYFRAQGATVVLGGVHVSLLPDEAAQHADAIVIGFAEQTWPQLLRDYANNSLQRIYRSDAMQLENLPHPRRDLQKSFRYNVPNTVFATRGCKGTCDFCAVPAAKFGWHQRPIPDVIAELKAIKSRRIAFNDVNLTEDSDYAKEFLTALIPLKKRWGGLASSRIRQDDELLDLMAQSGCQFILIGFESLNNRSLASMHKAFNKVEDYRELVGKLHDRNIVIQGCFIFGLDEDDRTVFEQTVDLVNDLSIDIPRYAIYTPFPGTPSFQRLQAENRLLHYRWEYYDTQHVVFQPAQMTPQELDDGFKWAFKETFRLGSSFRRTKRAGRNFPIAFIGNLAYKLYIQRLYAEEYRFPEQIEH